MGIGTGHASENEKDLEVTDVPARTPVKIFLFSLLCLSAWTTLASAAELSIGAIALPPGGSGTLAVAYASQGAQVSAVQFDLGYDTNNLAINPIAATSVRSAGKGRYYGVLASSQARLLVTGWNSNTLSDGPAFTLYVSVSPNAPAGVYNVTLANVVGVDGMGNPVPVSFGAGMVTVSGSFGSGPAIVAGGVLNGGSLLAGNVSAGGVVTLLGSAIGPATPATLQVTPQNTAATTLNNTQVTFDGTPAPLIYAGANQINVVVPFEVNAATTSMTISQNGQLIGPLVLPVAGSTPGLLTLDGSGVGAAFARNLPDMSLNTAANAAPAGSVVVLVLVGAGQSTPAQVTGNIDTASGATSLQVTATIGGLPATVVYSGPAPFLIAGATQLNLRIPAGVTPSPAVPVSIQVGNSTSQSDVFISVSAVQ
jgi:uncharacterized protein (TIGR03437 family)